jgi:hypothetical protein
MKLLKGGVAMDLMPMGKWITDKQEIPSYAISTPSDVKDEDIYWQEYKKESFPWAFKSSNNGNLCGNLKRHGKRGIPEASYPVINRGG